MDATIVETWTEPEARRRLVRLCARLSGDATAAEDLAQETLLEAWRNRHKLHDPSGAEAWVAAIARNVCLRSARRRGRDLPVADDSGEGAAIEDVDVLERRELAEVVGCALGRLPAETRDVLVQRFVHEKSPREIGERLGLSGDAVSMRLTRGTRLLRRLLAGDLEGGTAEESSWHATRIWCSGCGERRLETRRESAPGTVAFRCPSCARGRPGVQFPLANPAFARLLGDVVRPTAILARTAEWVRGYFAGGADARTACTRCARSVHLRRFTRDCDGAPSDGLYASCDTCGEQVSSSVTGIALSLPEVRRFNREHPRSRVVRVRRAEVGGAEAIVVRHARVAGAAGLDVAFDRDTLRVLHVAAA